jgi:hypothetical protein
LLLNIKAFRWGDRKAVELQDCGFSQKKTILEPSSNGSRRKGACYYYAGQVPNRVDDSKRFRSILFNPRGVNSAS